MVLASEFLAGMGTVLPWQLWGCHRGDGDSLMSLYSIACCFNKCIITSGAAREKLVGDFWPWQNYGGGG